MKLQSQKRRIKERFSQKGLTASYLEPGREGHYDDDEVLKNNVMMML